MLWTDTYLQALPGAFFFRHWRGFLVAETLCRDMMAPLEDAALARSQYFPPERIREIQLALIRKLVRHSYDTIPFWKNWLDRSHLSPDDIRSYADFERIPVIDKALLRSNPEEYYISTRVPQGLMWRSTTSGSTGDPFRYALDKAGFHRRLAAYKRLVGWAGLTPRRKLLRVGINKNRVGMEDERKYGAYIAIPNGATEEKLPELKRILSDGEWVIEWYASNLLEFARYAKEHGLRFGTIHSILPVSEGLAPEEREFIANTLGVPLYNFYSCRDLGFMGAECDRHEGIHLNAESMYLEIVDNAGKPVPPVTTGRIVVTVFDNLVMPLIRYDTGDYGAILPERCGCGRTLPLLRFEGRDIEYIKLPDGSTLHVWWLVPLLFRFVDHISNMQIVQEEENRIRILIVPRGILGDEVMSDMEAMCRKILAGRIGFDIKTVPSIAAEPGKKRKLLIRRV